MTKTTIMNIVHALRRAQGRNAKKDILVSQKGNTMWKIILCAMYDESINYYISAPTDYTFIDEDPDFDKMFDNLAQLRNRYVTGNAAREHARLASTLYGEIYRLILRGSLDCGIAITTINDVYPCLIPTFDVMLANKKTPQKYPLLVSTKYDGVRIIVEVNDSETVIKTRSGKVLQLDSLINKMSRKPSGIYDGELVKGDGLQSGRTTITGDVNKILKGSSTDIDDYTFMIFDYLTLKEWYNQECQEDYLCRLKYLISVGFIDPSTRPISITYINSSAEVDALFAEKLKAGYEGLILRYPEDPYEWRRTDALMKVKAIKSIVLTCTETIDGTGKYEGMIGSLVCEGSLGDKFIRVKVGTGLSDFDRDRPPEDYINHRIDAEYNDLVRAKEAVSYSLFLPVFKRIRGNFDV